MTDKLREAAQQALTTIEAAIIALTVANEQGKITDTIWFTEFETLFDFLGSEADALRAALAENDVQQEIKAVLAPEQEPVVVIKRNEVGQITMQTPDGNPFDMSKYIGAKLYTAPPEQEPVACIVKGCSNHRGEGRFIGALCSPCHTFITTGEGKYSQAYRNSKREWQALTENEMKNLADTHLVYQVETPEMSGVFDLIRAVSEKLEEKND